MHHLSLTCLKFCRWYTKNLAVLMSVAWINTYWSVGRDCCWGQSTGHLFSHNLTSPCRFRGLGAHHFHSADVLVRVLEGKKLSYKWHLAEQWQSQGGGRHRLAKSGCISRRSEGSKHGNKCYCCPFISVLQDFCWLWLWRKSSAYVLSWKTILQQQTFVKSVCKTGFCE